MSYCKNCGAELKGNEKHCPACEHEILTEELKTTIEENPRCEYCGGEVQLMNLKDTIWEDYDVQICMKCGRQKLLGYKR